MATGVATADPRLAPDFHDAFMAGLQATTTMVGLLCLVGAVVAAIALPGRRHVAPVEVEEPGLVRVPG